MGWEFKARTIWSTLGSSGSTHGAYDVRGGMEHTVYIQTANSTATVHILTGRTSTGPWHDLGSTDLGVNAATVLQFTGPLAWVTPRVEAISNTNGVTIELLSV